MHRPHRSSRRALHSPSSRPRHRRAGSRSRTRPTTAIAAMPMSSSRPTIAPAATRRSRLSSRPTAALSTARSTLGAGPTCPPLVASPSSAPPATGGCCRCSPGATAARSTTSRACPTSSRPGSRGSTSTAAGSTRSADRWAPRRRCCSPRTIRTCSRAPSRSTVRPTSRSSTATSRASSATRSACRAGATSASASSASPGARSAERPRARRPSSPRAARSATRRHSQHRAFLCRSGGAGRTRPCSSRNGNPDASTTRWQN